MAKTLEQKEIFTLSDLRKVLAEMSDGTRTQEINEPIDKWWDSRQPLVRQTLENLLTQKDKFRHVFRTGSGSYYFVTHSGENFRIKWNKEDQRYEPQPILKHLFFVDAAEWKRLMAMVEEGRTYMPVLAEDKGFQFRKKIYESLRGSLMSDEEFRNKDESRKGIQKLVGEPIAVGDLEPGTLPLEFDYLDSSEQTIFKVIDDRLILMGSRIKDQNNKEEIRAKLFAPLHYGSLVTEVIKG